MSALQGKTKTVDAILPAETFTVPPLSYFVNQSASYPNVLCYDSSMLMRCTCDYPKPSTAVIDQSIDSYSLKGLKYPIEALVQSSHASFAYQGLCSAWAEAAAMASATDQCTVLQTAYSFCPRYGSELDTTDCPDLNTTAVEDLDALTALLTASVALAESLGAGISVPADYIDNICARQLIGVAPLDGSGSVENVQAERLYAYLVANAPGIESSLKNFSSSDEVASYVGNSDYSRTPSIQTLGAAIVLEAGSPAWAYTLRANYTKDLVDGDYGYRERNLPMTDMDTNTGMRTPWDTSDEDGATILPYVQSYYQAGVLSLQQAVDAFIFDAEGAPAPTYRVANFASPEYDDSGFWATAGGFFSIVMVLVFMYPVANVIKQLVVEKELKIKEGMLQMGLSSVAYQTSWVVWFALVFFVMAVLLTLIGKSSIFQNSDAGIVFLWFYLFFLATIALCFLLSTFFSKARSASTYGTLIFFLTVFPYFGLTSDSSGGQLVAACIIPTTCFAVGTFPFADYEDSGQASELPGVTADTVGSKDTVNISMSQVLGMLFLDTVIYSLLAWYAGQVVPSEWGTQRPWYFLATKAYWRPGAVSASTAERISELLENDETKAGDRRIEPVDDALRKQWMDQSNSQRRSSPFFQPVLAVFLPLLCRQLRSKNCVALRGLGKTFPSLAGGTVTAVKDLNLTMYSGQITALLGHNGAGKTTTMNMLSGMIPVSSGEAIVNGRDVRTQMKAIRSEMGVCPQHDILYADLTVREHLRLFAVVKGVAGRDVEDEVERMIRTVGLTEKRDERTKGLSGGQKRKLSVGIAFIGGSRVVILDEPTSGMDPHSRRFTWNLIRQQKEGRTILLSTHFMEEADLLCERIAIMGHGELKCCGSSLFLKSHYGAGYNLTIVKRIAEGGQAAKKLEAEQRNEIKTLVKGFVRSAKVLSDVGAEVSFQLSGSATAQFKPMLLELDRRLDALGISSYGMSITTLEEVFLRVASGTADSDARNSFSAMRQDRQRSFSGVEPPQMQRQFSSSSASALGPPDKPPAVAAAGNGGEEGGGAGKEMAADEAMPAKPIAAEEFTGSVRFWRHVRALVVKRALTFKRDIKLVGFTLLAPSFFLLVGMLILLASQPTGDQPALLLDPTVYNDGLNPQNPLFYPSAVCGDSGTNETVTCDATAFVSALPSDSGIEGIAEASGVTATSLIEDLNTILLDSRSEYEASRYSAYAFESADAAMGAVDVVALANYTALHTAPMFLNQMANGALAVFADAEGSTAATVAFTMHPFPFTSFESSINSDTKTFPTVLFLLIGVAFVPAAWVGFLVRERETKSKHQQVVSGVSLDAYWCSTYLWDIVSFLPTPCISCILLTAFDISGLMGDGGAGAFALLVFLWGPASMGFSYILSFCFTQYASAMTNTLFINWLTGLMFSIAIFFMQLFPSTVKAAKALKWVLRFLPSYALGDGILNLGFRNLLTYLYGGNTMKAFDINVAGADILYLACCSVAYCLIVLYMERVFAGTSTIGTFFTNWRLRRRFRSSGGVEASLWDSDLAGAGGRVVEDSDVVYERDRVERTAAAAADAAIAPGGGTAAGAADTEGQEAVDVISMQGMRKVYPASKGSLKVALRNMWLGIPKGECFGLLGINGAGKSTTISILCGEQAPTQGKAYLAGHDIVDEPEAIHRLVGYCPQFDALFDTLTGREHLYMYARIKGIPENRVAEAVDHQLRDMNLGEYADKLAGGYSGGNKRKLSVAGKWLPLTF
ncbi:unnamed protein product [Phaeothamnion confervicola]